MKKISQTESYNFHKSGSFGRFYSGDSFPIEYIQTSFTSDELCDLTLARDIRPPDNIDFDLLIQRDIDEVRVKKEIEPYLNPKKSLAELKARVIFFPPLLAAVVPIQDKKMQYYYPNEAGSHDGEFVYREWPGLYKLKYFKNDGVNSYSVETLIEGEYANVNVDIEQVEIGLRLVKGSQLGAKLVVIDGQHRLFTLMSLLDKDSSIIENLVVPVCILMSPNSTADRKMKYPVEIPTVPEVFRHLFVDVNKTVELVGGHFNILLSDNNMSSLICRHLCDSVLKDTSLGPKALAVIEWNTKTAKESTTIQRDYSLTSIGIIDQALTESIGDNKYLIKYMLNLAARESELYPDEDGDIEHPTVTWTTFSTTQKKILDEQIKSLIITPLKRIFYETCEFKKAYVIFEEEIDKLISVANTGDPDDAIEAKSVVNQVLEYIPIGSSSSHDKERVRYRKFELNIKERREAEVATIIAYSIFQRSMILTWSDLLKYGRQKNITINNVTNGLIDLLDIALKHKGSIYNFDKPYMQHSVFDSTKIKPKSETKKALSSLTLAFLGDLNVAKSFLSASGYTLSSVAVSELVELGQNKASEFIRHYEKERKKTFRGSYKVDFSIDKDDREELIKAEEKQKLHLKEVRDGHRNKADVDNEFDDLVDKYVKKDVDLASKSLKELLNYASDIVAYDIEADDNGE